MVTLGIQKTVVSTSSKSVDLPVDLLEIPAPSKDGDTGCDEPDGTKSDE